MVIEWLAVALVTAVLAFIGYMDLAPLTGSAPICSAFTAYEVCTVPGNGNAP